MTTLGTRVIVHGAHRRFFLECFRSRNISTLIRFYLDEYRWNLLFLVELHGTFPYWWGSLVDIEVGNFVSVGTNRLFFFCVIINKKKSVFPKNDRLHNTEPVRSPVASSSISSAPQSFIILCTSNVFPVYRERVKWRPVCGSCTNSIATRNNNSINNNRITRSHIAVISQHEKCIITRRYTPL